MTADHELVVTFDRDVIEATVRCNAKFGAECRLECEEGCETGISIQRDSEGWFHPGQEWSEVARHAMVDAGYCIATEWINDDSATASATANVGTFEISRVAITPVWNGDYYQWSRASS